MHHNVPTPTRKIIEHIIYISTPSPSSSSARLIYISTPSPSSSSARRSTSRNPLCHARSRRSPHKYIFSIFLIKNLKIISEKTRILFYDGARRDWISYCNFGSFGRSESQNSTLAAARRQYAARMWSHMQTCVRPRGVHSPSTFRRPRRLPGKSPATAHCPFPSVPFPGLWYQY